MFGWFGTLRLPGYWPWNLVVVFYGSYNGAMVVFLTEIMPVDVRTSGFALAIVVGDLPIFSAAFTPALCTYLIHISETAQFQGCGLVAPLWPNCTLFRQTASRHDTVHPLRSLILRQQQGVSALRQESLDRLQIDCGEPNNRLPLTRGWSRPTYAGLNFSHPLMW